MINRFLLSLTTLVGISLIIFVIMRVLPGDVAVTILVGQGGEGTIDAAKLADLRQQLGLDRPLFLQYVDWASSLVRLDGGRSLVSGRPVFDEIRERLPMTIELAGLTIVVASLIAVPLGVLSAVRHLTWIDHVSRVFGSLGLAMPTFWSGTLLLLLLASLFKWVPPLGYVNIWEDPLRNLQQMVWPAVALGYFHTAVVSRMTRSCMLEVLGQDYVRTARAKGLQPTTILVRHVLRNAMLPVVTVIGFQLAVMMGGTVIMENIFNIPGMGRGFVASILERDYPIVQAMVMVFAVIIVFGNLAVDLLYSLLDPRIKLG